MSTILGWRQRRLWPPAVGLLGGFLLVMVAVFAGAAGADASTSSEISRPRATAADHAHPAVDSGVGSSGGTGDVRVIVGVRTGGHDPAVAAVRTVGDAVGADLPLVDGFAVPHAGLPQPAAVPTIRAVTLDRVGHVTGRSYNGAPSASSFVSATGADTSWRAGRHREGVRVAVIDTGGSPRSARSTSAAVLLILVAVLMALIVAIITTWLKRSTGTDIATALLYGGGAFGGTMTLIILVMDRTGAFS